MSFLAKLVEYHTMPPAAAHQDVEQVLLPMAGAHGQAESRKQKKMSPDSKSTQPSTAARGVDSKQTSQDAPRASAPTCRKQRQGRRFQTEFSGCSTHQHSHPENRDKVVASKENSTRQRCHAPKTARRSSIPNRILRTLHAPALQHAEVSERARRRA